MKILLFILTPLVMLFTPRYDNIFSEGYDEALSFLEKNSSIINTILDDEYFEKEVIISVVFPELMKHSFLIDYFQERAMELIYIKHSKEKADFSIGRFQMKPSFVERLEEYVRQSDNIKKEYAFIATYQNNSSPKDIREERISRMKSLKWQLYYMKCFYAIMIERFDTHEWNNVPYKIKILATAYNHDFMADISELEEWSKKSMFPYGKRNNDKKQYAYSKISTYFYHKDWDKLSKKLQEKQKKLSIQ